MARRISPQTSLDSLKKEAKRWLKALREGDATARDRFARTCAKAPAKPGLRDIQHALALEFGLTGWTELKHRLEAQRPPETDTASPKLRDAASYEQLAKDWVSTFDARDAAALDRLNRYYDRAYTLDDVSAEIWRRMYAVRRRSSTVPKNYLELPEAQTLVAQDAGFSSWEALLDAVATGAPPAPGHALDAKHNRIAPRRQLNTREWNELVGVMRERRIPTLEANGLMTDDVLRRVAELDCVTSLGLEGSRQLTDAGLRHLVKMPQVRSLNLAGANITDHGLEVLRRLPNLRTFEMTWQRGVTDAGVANLRFCEQLERVNLMGSATGDGAIEALRGKPRLRYFNSGRLVTDAGLRFLREFPMFRIRSDHRINFAVMGDIADAIHLLIDGPFTNDGLASLRALDGVEELGLFWHATEITSDSLAHLADMPNLASLNCDGRFCDDQAMRHIAAMPALRKLVAQEAVATEDGFVALGKSRTLAFIWGRECPNFGSRAFVAFSKMPALRALGIGCQNVDDAALAALPESPALREITAIGFADDGFRHIGACERLERLLCMYCRGAGDAATEHIAGLKRLKYYYAGLTNITDRSLQILGQIESLEQVELYECKGVTDEGLKFLARLPRLKEVQIAASPHVTFAGTTVFPPGVHVEYSLGG